MRALLAAGKSLGSSFGHHITEQSLSVSFERLWFRFGRLEDLETSLDFQQHIFSTLTINSPEKGWWMAVIALTYSRLFDNTGKLEYLESGVHWGTLSLGHTPENHKDMHIRRLVLSGLLIERSKARSDVNEANKAILLNKRALETMPVQSTEYLMMTMSLAVSYGNRYELTKDSRDLDSALSLALETMRSFPRDNHYYPQFSFTTSQQYLHKYRHDHNIIDLENALRYCQVTIDTTKANTPSLGLYKGHMAGIYLDFYRRFGSMADLESAIDLCMTSVSLLPPNHAKIAFQQLNLSSMYLLQYRRHQDIERLESALQWGNLALKSAKETSRLYIESLHQLSILWESKSKLSRNPQDLNQALHLMQRVIDATPQDSPELPSCYSSMASLYATQYAIFGGPEIRDTILMFTRAAVEAGERLEDPDLPVMQNSLALQYLNNYLWLREENDLNSALHFSELSAENTPEHHIAGALRYKVLAGIYAQKFALDHDEEVKKLTLDTYRHASRFIASNPDIQWDLAYKWAQFADSIQSPEALDAYRHAFNVLPALLWLGTNIATRHEALVKYEVAEMASNAIVSCIQNNNHEAAIESLEQSLSVTLNQLLDLQTDLSLLETHHPDLANDLRRISENLRQLSTATPQGEEEELSKYSSRDSDRMRKLALERGYSPEAVMITSTNMRCDALILLNAQSSPVHLRLFRVNTSVLQTQYQRLKKALEELGIHTRDLREADRGGRVARQQKSSEQTKLDEVLQWLYTMVVSPIYDVLRENSATGGRLWWCPTGLLTYFPLHAAGPPNNFVPSYTSTLNSLLRGRKRRYKPATNSKIIVIGISELPDGGYAPLPNVMKEVQIIKEVTPHKTIIVNSQAVTRNVVTELPAAEWLHLACHGQQGNPKEPLNSCLLLYDDKLYLKQLLSMPLPNAELVFLSACETAMGDTTMSNEALHLAGGMLFAGFGAAIATLWSINDDDGPVVARVVYEHLFHPGSERSAVDSAEALKKAVDHLREMGVPTYRWVPFIHIGV
ncbi:hypothetical protein NP233_g7889 [Leucocoprinus birnbaumii]|uniref:CHAT domain-containing protein n=1 Tax=Leucocoprinus birnbaumii TaxID=56174 RepID=A0AAD5YUC0_9AGAR|nr:hypothetical protein NP233_g7889 [Leucocoprinus birnbaumii]